MRWELQPPASLREIQRPLNSDLKPLKPTCHKLYLITPETQHRCGIKKMAAVEVLVTPSPFANLAPLYEVDPDADALLIVPTSNQPFAPWEDPFQVNGINGLHKKKTHAAAPASRPGLRIKVSSKHLALASRVFRNKLQFGSTKATRQSDGRVHLKLAEGFDPKAVSIVVNAVHGRGSQVPKAVDLETLAQIAVVVDRLQLLDAVDVYADRWISKLEGRIQDVYDRDLVLWIFISHVFRRSDIFKAVSKTAAAQAQGPIQTLNLPIREKIISQSILSPLSTPQETPPTNSLRRPHRHRAAIPHLPHAHHAPPDPRRPDHLGNPLHRAPLRLAPPR